MATKRRAVHVNTSTCTCALTFLTACHSDNNVIMAMESKERMTNQIPLPVAQQIVQPAMWRVHMYRELSHEYS